MMYKKRIIYLFLTIFMMLVIFLFSSQASENSNYLSYSITEKIFKKIETKETSSVEENKITDLEEKENITATNEDTFPTSDKAFRNINAIIRKSAHIFLYMMLGIFLILFIKTYNISAKKAIILTVLFCFIYACLDEFNQYLGGTRTASFKDSLIDTFGCILGCFIINEKNLQQKFKKLLHNIK